MILAVDCGLSAVKVVLASADGRVQEVEREAYATVFDGVRAEQDPEDWWRAFVAACSRLTRRDAVEVVVPTGHMHATVLLGDDGALLPCYTLHDRRGAHLLERLDPDAFHAATGALCEALLPLAKLLWVRDEHPEVLARSRALLAPKDYLRWRLTGAVATEPVDAAGTGLYDPRAASWSETVLGWTGLPEEILPPVHDGAAIAGGLRPDAARELGLRSGIPVAVGAGDDIELLGATAHAPRHAVEHVGTTGAVLRALDSVPEGLNGSLELYPTARPARYATGCSVANVGSVMTWVRGLGVDLAAALDGALDESHPVGVPQLLAERFPSHRPARSGVIAGIGVADGPRELGRAMLLGVAFALADLVEAVEVATGPISALHSSGGATEEGWLRLRASAHGKPLVVSADDATALGCVALGLVALGAAPDAEEAAGRLIGNGRRVDPEPELAGTLAVLRDRYRAARDAL